MPTGTRKARLKFPFEGVRQARRCSCESQDQKFWDLGIVFFRTQSRFEIEGLLRVEWVPAGRCQGRGCGKVGRLSPVERSPLPIPLSGKDGTP